jgi:hypothetical protein
MTRNKSDALLLTMQRFTIVNVAGAAMIRLPLMAGPCAGREALLKRVELSRSLKNDAAPTPGSSARHLQRSCAKETK